MTPEEVGREEDSLAWTQSQTQGQPKTTDCQARLRILNGVLEKFGRCTRSSASLGSEENAELEVRRGIRDVRKGETQASPALVASGMVDAEKLQHGMWTSPNTTAPCRPKMLRRSFSKLQIGGAQRSAVWADDLFHTVMDDLAEASGFWRIRAEGFINANCAGVRVNQEKTS